MTEKMVTALFSPNDVDVVSEYCTFNAQQRRFFLTINKWSNRSSTALKWFAVINDQETGDMLNPGASFTLAPGDDHLPPGADVSSVGWASSGFSGLLVSRAIAEGTALVALDGSATSEQIDEAFKNS